MITKRRLGQTQIFLPSVSFGCGAFAGCFGDVQQNIANLAVEEAYKQGINFFDTAPLYSSSTTRSEIILGNALKGKPRDSFIVNTKCGRDRIGNESIYDYTGAGVRKSFQQSLKRLQLDYVDMFTLHDVEFANSMDQIVNEALPELRKIQKEGGARYIGISGYPLDVLLAVARRFKVDYVLTYSNYCLQNESLVDYVDEFTKLGCGIINAAPLVLGYFTKQGPGTFHYAPEPMKKLAPIIAKFAGDKGIDISHLAIKYAVHAPLTKTGVVSTTLVGVANVEQVRVMLKTLQPMTKVEEDCAQSIKQIFKDNGWFNYRWKEKQSNQDILLVNHVPPQRTSKL